MCPLSVAQSWTNWAASRGAGVVTVVEVLDDGFAVVEFVGVGDVVEEEEQLVGRGGERFINLGDFGRVLAGEACAGGDGAVHADAFVIGAMPLAPSVVFAGSMPGP